MTELNAVHHYLDRHLAEGRAELPAIVTRDAILTFAEVSDRVDLAAGALHESGVRAGDRVVLVLPDAPDAVAFLLAAMGVGAVPVPIHVGLSDEEYRSIYEDCRPAATVLSPTHRERIERLPPVAGSKVALFVSGETPSQDGLGRGVPVEHALASAEPRGLSGRRPDEPALLQYTSGSTGAPKAVVHRHEALLALPRGFASYLELDEGDLCFSAAKLFFGYGLGNSLFFPFDAGAAVFLREEPSDPVGILEAVDAARPTVFFGGPTLYTAILALTRRGSKFDLSSVRLFVSAGEALSPQTFEEWAQRFGSPIMDGLGSTECLHIFAASRPAQLRPGRLGPPVPEHEIRIVAEDGALVDPGAPGIAEVRAPSVSRGYWNRPEETSKTMVSGWVRTGDVVREHEDGSLEFVGREDDVFKVRGMKVAPLEIEQRLAEHPAVRECAVVPRTDRWGLQVSHAVVCLEPGWQPSEELAQEIRTALLDSLSKHKVPQTIHFARALPRSNTGKLSRRRIREGQVEFI